MGKPADAKMDQALASDLARREGIKAIITGEITSLGSGYSLAARVINANTGETLVPIRETASDASQIIGAVDKLSKALREKVGESLGRIRAGDPLEQVTTSSLEALRLYTEAVRDHAAGKSEDAVKLLRQAVAVDSTFAMAWRKLAVVLPQAVLGSDAEARDAATRAYKFRDRLPPVERGLTEAYYYSAVTGDQEKEEAAYRAVLAENPDEPAALNNLGLLLSGQGRAAEAEPILRHLVATSQLQSGYLNLNAALVLEGKSIAADSVLNEFRRRWPESTRSDDMLRFAEYVRRDYRGADSLIRDPRRREPVARSLQVAVEYERISVAAALGRVAESERLAAQLVPTMTAAGDRVTVFYLRTTPATDKLYFLGDAQALARATDSLMPKAVLDSLPEDQRPFAGMAYAYAVAGRPDRVRQLRAEWVRVRPAERRSPADSVYWDAMTAQAEGRWRDAAMAYDEHRLRIKCPICDLTDAAHAWERAGESDSALTRYEASVTLPDPRTGPTDAPWTLGPTYKRLGEMYEAKGDRARALQYYGEFVNLWQDADPVLQPQVKDVRGRMAGLAGEK
jgi:tetratricopeptide (TPR) repeat protein